MEGSSAGEGSRHGIGGAEDDEMLDSILQVSNMVNDSSDVG